MDFLLDLFHKLRDLDALVAWAGLFGLATIIYTETGLFFGFFLPGDSLLVTAGLLSATPDSPVKFDIVTLGSLLSVAAILGDNTNYWVGRLTGPRIFKRDDSLFFKRKYVDEAHAFYEKWGPLTVVLCRFMPIIRTFAPLVAGVAQMDYRVFLTYSVLGGVSWIWSMVMTGYLLGTYVPGVAQHVEKVIIAVVLLSISPALIGAYKARRAARGNP
ncbi:MAG: VTT domain-containing protein [Gemmatimonadetes bacterium]|nr:VTT domain-containing protein [Gemmatimonadota bacterium]